MGKCNDEIKRNKYKEELPKGVIRICKSKKDRQHNGQKIKVQKDKQRSTKYYTENNRLSNTNLTKNRGLNQVLRKDQQFLIH